MSDTYTPVDDVVATVDTALRTAEAQLTAIIDSDIDKLGSHWAAACDARRAVRDALYALSLAD